MDAVDLAVLRRARDWLGEGHGVTLYTVVQTWGSAPRQPGSLLALRSDGRVEGSVSGGCVEDDLLARLPVIPKVCADRWVANQPIQQFRFSRRLRYVLITCG